MSSGLRLRRRELCHRHAVVLAQGLRWRATAKLRGDLVRQMTYDEGALDILSEAALIMSW